METQPGRRVSHGSQHRGWGIFSGISSGFGVSGVWGFQDLGSGDFVRNSEPEKKRLEFRCIKHPSCIIGACSQVKP